MGRSSSQKINKGILDLNYILYQVDLTDIYRTFVTKQMNKFKKVEIILGIFSNKNGMKVGIKTGKLEYFQYVEIEKHTSE